MLTPSIFLPSFSGNSGNPIPTITTATYHDAAAVVPIILQLQAYTAALVLWGLSLCMFLSWSLLCPFPTSFPCHPRLTFP
jgi:hypothetical protein